MFGFCRRWGASRQCASGRVLRAQRELACSLGALNPHMGGLGFEVAGGQGPFGCKLCCQKMHVHAIELYMFLGGDEFSNRDSPPLPHHLSRIPPCYHVGLRVYGFGVWGSGSGFRVWGPQVLAIVLGFSIQSCTVWGLRSWVLGVWFTFHW